jgi:hypothetical protein
MSLEEPILSMLSIMLEACSGGNVEIELTQTFVSDEVLSGS